MLLLITFSFSQGICLKMVTTAEFGPAEFLLLLGHLRVSPCHLGLPWRIPNPAHSKRRRRRLGHTSHIQHVLSCILLYLSVLQHCCC